MWSCSDRRLVLTSSEIRNHVRGVTPDCELLIKGVRGFSYGTS